MNEFFDKLSEISFGKLNLVDVLSVLLLFLVCFIAIRIISKIAGGVIGKSKLEDGIKGFMLNAVKVVLWLIAIIIIAEIIADRLGMKTTSLVAVMSVAGLALSLSIQDTMSNLFSGMTILATKPFSSGDYVELDAVGGTVTEVGLFYTTITMIDNKVVYVPNGQVTSAKIINYTRQDKRRVDFTFRASYEDATELVLGALKDVVSDDLRILREPAPPFTGLMAYKESSIEYVLRVWVESKDYWDVYFGLNERVREIFTQRGIRMPFDQINVHVIGNKD